MVLSMQRWKGKVAVITGASAGIGAKIAEMLVKNGMIVIGLARRVELVEALSKKLQGQPGKLHGMKVDMTDQDAIVKAFKEIEKKFDPVHVLVNNAGIFPQGSLLNGTTDLWKKVLDTNVLALCTSTREAISIMKKNGVVGHVVNINAVAGHKNINIPGMNIYCGSKFAVTAISETLRQELRAEGSKIKITSLSPGAVRTEAVNRFGLQNLDKVPIVEAEDVSDAAEYVLSTPPHVLIHELIVRPVGETV